MLIAITGGIGCGKSVVSRLLEVMGYTVYDCDSNAKSLMLKDIQLRESLIRLFGQETYRQDGSLNKPHLSSAIFGNPEALRAMNSLIHPAVAHDLLAKYRVHSNNLFFYESAILFESQFNKLAVPDFVICVSAPLELRIERTMARDKSTRQQILDRIGSQMSQEEKDQLADYVICNDSKQSVIMQTDKIITNINHKSTINF